MSEAHVVGAKPLPLPDGVEVRAIYGGPSDCYRYRLEWRQPMIAQRTIMWLMMNPSVAGHDCADRTVLKCWAFSGAWGYSRMLIGNSAAYRATDQGRLSEAPDPVGPENAAHLAEMAAEADIIIAAYGSPKVKAARRFGPEAADMLRKLGHDLHAMRLSSDGTPWHPLFLPGAALPAVWRSAT